MKLSRRQAIAIVALGGAFVVLSGIGIYGLVIGPKSPGSTSPTAEPSTRPSTAPPGDPVVPIPVTDDPEVFATAIAHAIFDWNTAADVDPSTISEHVATVADPTGFETPGLYQDLTNYLPTKAQWQVLRDYGTAQSLTIDSLAVPSSWPAITADPSNQIATGTVAITVEGTRTRTGGWDGTGASKSYPVEFTMFLSCPAQGTCALLRLSALGSALH